MQTLSSPVTKGAEAPTCHMAYKHDKTCVASKTARRFFSTETLEIDPSGDVEY